MALNVRLKIGQFVAGTFQNCIFPQDCDSKNSDTSQDLHECDNMQDDLLRAVLLHVSWLNFKVGHFFLFEPVCIIKLISVDQKR